MNKHNIPERAQKFLIDCIDSLEQLHVLRLLHEARGDAWTIESISQDLRSTPSSVEKRIQDLQARRVLSKEAVAADGAIRYLPYNSEISLAVDETLLFFRHHQYTVIDFIFSKPIAAVQSFANAFRLKKEDS